MNTNHCRSSWAAVLLLSVVAAGLMQFSGCNSSSEPANAESGTPAADDSKSSDLASDVDPDPNNRSSVTAKTDPTVSQPPVQPKIELGVYWDAALNGNLQLVRQALESGVDVDAADDQQRTALMLAAFNGHAEVAKLLLEQGAEVDHLDAVGRTSLMFAATGANPETVEILIQAGAKVDTADNGEGFTALMHAAAEGQADVVAVLLKHHADPSITDKDGDTAKDFAVRNGHREVIRQLIKQLP